MQIKIVNYPNNKNPQWTVTTKLYREKDGGMKNWLEYIKNSNADIIYLYDIKATVDEIVIDYDKTETDIVYSVRFALVYDNTI
jgi:hypothetical protein